MKKATLILFLLILINCTKKKNNTTNTIASNNKINYTETSLNYFDSQKKVTKPYQLNIKSEKIKNNIHEITIAIALNNGAYFVSPNSERDFKGKFKVIFDKYETIKLTNKLQEIPLSVEEIDPHPFVNGAVNWVRKDTKYKQRIQLTSKNDFQVEGIIQFTIEPRCSLEQIPFIIKHENGKLKTEIIMC